jgi:hypothetical protein
LQRSNVQKFTLIKIALWEFCKSKVFGQILVTFL